MTPVNMAQYLTLRFQIEGIPITPLKLQKLLYYIQAWHITLFEKDMLYDELPQAWVNGPAYYSVFVKYRSKFNKNMPIVDTALKGEALRAAFEESITNLNLNADKYKFLNAVVSKYGAFTDEKLVYLTHAESPWNQAREGLQPFASSTRTISVDSMYDCYNARVKKNG